MSFQSVIGSDRKNNPKIALSACKSFFLFYTPPPFFTISKLFKIVLNSLYSLPFCQLFPYTFQGTQRFKDLRLRIWTGLINLEGRGSVGGWPPLIFMSTKVQIMDSKTWDSWCLILTLDLTIYLRKNNQKWMWRGNRLF